MLSAQKVIESISNVDGIENDFVMYMKIKIGDIVEDYRRTRRFNGKSDRDIVEVMEYSERIANVKNSVGEVKKSDLINILVREFQSNINYCRNVVNVGIDTGRLIERNEGKCKMISVNYDWKGL